MSEKEIQKLRRKFIFLSMFSFVMVMLFIGGVIMTFSYIATSYTIKRRLEGISGINGSFNNEDIYDLITAGDKPKLPSFSEAFAPDYRHNHYFIFSYNENGIIECESNSFDNEEIEYVSSFASDLLGSKEGFGRFGNYYYLNNHSGSGNTITILDCISEMIFMIRLSIGTVFTCTIALLITLILVICLSGRMVRPEIENARRQKQFITNASHELKTPLAVIRANTEVLEMTGGSNEWTESTLNQVDRLNGLIQNLVQISKASEREDKSCLCDIDATAVTRETLKNYEALSKQSKKELISELEDNVHIVTDESKFRQLITILLDNAFKYCDEDGSIKAVLLSKGKKSIILTVTNDFKNGSETDAQRYFDRFYREDTSHNIDKGGYGIGLSIAESICKGTGGSIKAVWKDGKISFICQIK